MGTIKRENRYVYLLPHEILLVKDSIEDFYREIGFTEGYENIDVFVDDIVETVRANPYQFFLVAVNDANKVLGYAWFYVDRNILGETYMSIEHDYIAPEIRESLGGARVHKKLLDHMVEVSKRCGCSYTNTVTRSEELKKSRERLGFKTIEYKMRFDGTGNDFIEKNPLFAQYVKP